MFPAALAVPKLRAEFETLYRDRKVAEATLVFALERLEAAAANEARDVSTFVVLDFPTVPTRKSRPKRLLILLLSTVLAVLGAVSWEWWRSLEPRPETFTLRAAQSGGRRPGAIAAGDDGAA
jgi:LPS O-antigen subunit length determinant protein (WzzB/FepE family)